MGNKTSKKSTANGKLADDGSKPDIRKMFNNNKFELSTFPTPEREVIQTMVLCQDSEPNATNDDDKTEPFLWVSYSSSTTLAKLSLKGKLILNSDELPGKIFRTVAWLNGGVLVAVFNGQSIHVVDSRGYVSPFSNVCDTPQRTDDVTVGESMNVFVLLYDTGEKKDHKVIELNKNGVILREIGKNKYGKQLFKNPKYITVSEELLVLVYKRIPLLGGRRPRQCKLLSINTETNCYSRTKPRKESKQLHRDLIGPVFIGNDVIMVDLSRSEICTYNAYDNRIEELVSLEHRLENTNLISCYCMFDDSMYLAYGPGLIKVIKFTVKS